MKVGWKFQVKDELVKIGQDGFTYTVEARGDSCYYVFCKSLALGHYVQMMPLGKFEVEGGQFIKINDLED